MKWIYYVVPECSCAHDVEDYGSDTKIGTFFLYQNDIT
jgi:hypothetical protein